MKSRSLLASFATLIALTVAPAMAADMRMPVKAPPPVAASVYNWSGFYIGAHVGGTWGDKDWPLTDSNAVFLLFPGFPHFGSHDVSGLIAGGQIGFNWQAPGSNWVLGIEAQASWSNADGEHTIDALGFRTDVEWLGTVTGRLGYAFDRVLVYAKGGFAFAHDQHELFFLGGSPSLFTDKTRTGWTVGGGAELALWQNWSAKLEYNYMDFGKKDVTFTDTVNDVFLTFNVDQQIHVVKLGINYRLGGGPVVARY
jgi:outer membrane immunogenic protein